MTKLTRRIVVCFAVLAGSVAGLSAQTVQYVYDELGRLVAVVAPNGESAVYSYDAVGNLLSIARHAANAVTIVEFTPNARASRSRLRALRHSNEALLSVESHPVVLCGLSQSPRPRRRAPV